MTESLFQNGEIPDETHRTRDAAIETINVWKDEGKVKAEDSLAMALLVASAELVDVMLYGKTRETGAAKASAMAKALDVAKFAYGRLAPNGPDGGGESLADLLSRTSDETDT